MRRPKILITGANGSLGRDVVSAFSEKDFGDIIPTTRQQLDLNWNRQQIQTALGELRPDLIINCAAYTNVDGAETEREAALAINAKTPETMAEWVSKSPERFLVHISTDYVFDGKSGNTFYTPQDKTNPVNYYGQSKLLGEQAILAIAESQSAIVRTSWLFGMKQQGFVSFVLKALQAKKPANIAADQIGTPTWTGNLTEMIQDVIAERRTGLLHGTATGATSRFDQALFLCDCLKESPDLLRPILTSELGLVATRPLNTSMQSSFASALSWQENTEKYLARALQTTAPL